MEYPDLINNLAEPSTTATEVERIKYLIKLIRKKLDR